MSGFMFYSQIVSAVFCILFLVAYLCGFSKYQKNHMLITIYEQLLVLKSIETNSEFCAETVSMLSAQSGSR